MRIIRSALMALAVVLAEDAHAYGQERAGRRDALIAAVYPSLDEEDRLGARPGWQVERHAAACKVWPAHPQSTLLAVPLSGPAESESLTRGDLDVWVLDTVDGRPRQHVRLDHALDGDAIYADGVTLDTAPYRLDADTVAFGIRVRLRGSSRVNPFDQSHLRLLVIDELADTLRTVLPPIVMDEYGGEWDGNCVGEFEYVKRTLAVEPRGNGHADLVVRESATGSRSQGEPGACESSETPARHRSWRLRFEGGGYAVPSQLRPVS